MKFDIHDAAFERITRPEVRKRVKQVYNELGYDAAMMLSAMVMVADETGSLEADDDALTAFINANLPIMHMFINHCVEDIEIVLPRA